MQSLHSGPALAAECLKFKHACCSLYKVPDKLLAANLEHEIPPHQIERF